MHLSIRKFCAVLGSSLFFTAACSQGVQQDNESAPKEAVADGQSGEVVTPPVAKEAPSQTANRGEKMNASVSGLNANISDLNVRVTDHATIVELPSDVLFEFDKHTLTPAANAPLAKLLTYVQSGADGPIVIVGHSDAKGEEAYNLALSQKRAQTVADWLKGQGVDQPRILASGQGEANPIAPNEKADGSDDPDGRAKNRRVTVTIPR